MKNSTFPIAQLGEVVRYRKEFINVDNSSTYKRLRIQLHVKGIILRDSIVGAAIKTKKQQVCRSGELVVAEIDAKVGGFGIVPPGLDGAIVSSHYFVFEINNALLDRRFLGYILRTPQFRDQVTAQGSTNYAAIRPSDVLRYEIPLPHVTEQQRIVARTEELLTELSEVRRLRREATELAGTLLSSVLRSVFDEYSTHYPTKKLGEVCRTTSGGTPSRGRPDFFSGTIPWIKSGELEDSVVTEADEYISEAALNASSAKLLPSNTLLVALYGATTGRTGVLGMDAATNQAVCAVFPEKILTRDYVWWFLRRMRPVYLSNSFGGAQPNISQKVLRESKIPVPPLDKQQSLVLYLDNLNSKLSSVTQLQIKTVSELDAVLPSILNKTFRGEQETKSAR